MCTYGAGTRFRGGTLGGPFDRTAKCWELPVALEGEVNQIVLWIQVLTGMELDGDGLFRDLDAATWHKRRQLLIELGGSPEVASILEP